MVTAAGTQYYHQSRIYSVMALSNQSGQLAERYGYTPYGKRRVVSPVGATLAASAVGNQVGFTGRYHDGESGLTYFRARYQDAELGRFVSRDPMGFADVQVRGTGVLRMGRVEPASLGGLYRFAGSNPAKWLDPLGLETEAECLRRSEKNCRDHCVRACVPSVCEALCMDAMKTECQRTCIPCPPPGPPYSAIDRTHSHWPCKGAHIHHYVPEVNQIPYPNCKCTYKDREVGVTCLEGYQDGAAPP